MNSYEFKYSVNAYGRVVDIGGCRCIGEKKNKTLLIIGGLGGTVEGYKNKYVNCAESLLEHANVISISTPKPFVDYNHLEIGIEAIRKNFPMTTEIYVWGHSVGAYYALRDSGYGDYTIKRMVLTNMPITVFLYDKIMDCLTKAGEQASIEKMDFVYAEFDRSYPYRVKLTENDFKKVKVHTAWGQDHDFSFSLKQFINIPKKYLFYDFFNGR